jgi:D-glycero-alpha-D-manno-heptose 1-phosphate guanylyltransferase
MKAFVLAGGLGTRLRPQFGDLPKGIAPVAGKPFLSYVLAWLERHGVREVVLCTGHGAALVRETLGKAGAGRIQVTYSVEDAPLGTAGALRLAAAHVDGPALIANGDTLLDCDPWVLERCRWEHGALGAVALYQVDDARSRGRVEMDGDRITRFVEKDDAFVGPAWVNGGLYAFSSLLWKRLPEGVSSLERDVLPALAAEGRLVGQRVHGEFFDIGTPEAWAKAERHLSSGRA